MRLHWTKLVMCASVCLVTRVSSAAGITGIDLQYISDSNPAKAELNRDIEATSAVRGRLTGNLLSFGLLENDSVARGFSINGLASYEANSDVEGLGESRYRASLNWFREARKSRGQPFVRLSLGVGYNDSETLIRDGSFVDVSTSINFQFASFMDTTLGAQVSTNEAETEVFDISKTQVFATANFSPTASMVLRAGFRYVMGNEVSTSTPTVPIVNNATAIEPDAAFGGVDDNRFAYLIDANSAVAEAGIGYAVSHVIEANLLYRFVSTEAEGDISYDRSFLEFTLSFNL